MPLNMGGPTSGEMTGLGEGTMTVVVAELGEKTATWSWCGAVYLGDNGIVGTRGHGTLEENGKHHWRWYGHATTSDGHRAVVEGEADFATQTLTGKGFEWN